MYYKIAVCSGADLSQYKYPEPVNFFDYMMSSSQSGSRRRKRGSASTLSTKSTTNTKTTKSSGPYDRNFQQKLIDGGIYPDEYEYPDGRVPPLPQNWEELNQRLGRSRASLSPSQFPIERFREFKRADAHVSKENKTTKRVIPIIEGKITDNKCDEGDILFTNLDPLTTDVLTAAKPDLYYGARPEQLDRRVREHLSGHIIPSTQDSLPIAPNFFLAAKGPDGSLTVAGKQACYDGALGARAMHSLEQYGQEPVYENNAKTITSIYHGGQLKIYTSHSAQPDGAGSRPEYFMNQVGTWGMTGFPDTFRAGATAYRNARDWAKEQRDEAIRRANERVGKNQADTLPADSSFGQASGAASEATLEENYTLSQESQALLIEDSDTSANLQESETSMDELALVSEPPAKRPSGRSKRSLRSQQEPTPHLCGAESGRGRMANGKISISKG